MFIIGRVSFSRLKSVNFTCIVITGKLILIYLLAYSLVNFSLASYFRLFLSLFFTVIRMSNSDNIDGGGGLKRGRGPSDCLDDSDEDDLVCFSQRNPSPERKKCKPKKSGGGKRFKGGDVKSSKKKGASQSNFEKGKALVEGEFVVHFGVNLFKIIFVSF